MLAFLAAVIPIIGSLYAGGSFLVGMVRVDHEMRVRSRIAPIVDGYYERTRDRWKAAAIDGRMDWDALVAERVRFEHMLLDANGVTTKHPTNRDVYTAQMMSAPLVPRAERRRQAVLLISAVIGVVLLALDTIGGGAIIGS